MSRSFLFALAVLAPGQQANAHPHVFVDGGVDFVVGDGGMLEALRVTWLYDPFETLYILSSHELSLNAEGGLDEADRQELIRARSDWPEDFDGSAHLKIDGALVTMDWPSDLDAHLIDGRLEVTFLRRLSEPAPLAERTIEVAFYESTYFFAFSVSKSPEVLGSGADCATKVIPFSPDAQSSELQSVLARLGREETPEINNVGALFADRIELSCV